MEKPIQFCPCCGNRVDYKIPLGETLPRHVCEQCETIHYQNPKLIVGCIPEYQGKVLMCRRAIEPRSGFWTLPAGFMENLETTSDGALRETIEETRAHVEIGPVYCILNLASFNLVYLFYRANLVEPVFGPTSESSEVALFGEEDIPWEELAFLSIRETLARYFKDRKKNRYLLHQIDL